MKPTPLKWKASPKKRKPRPASHRLWDLCKAIIRATYPHDCYTCPAKNLAGSNLHTGHFISKSICSTELAYDLKNLRPQCYACNVHRSGNWPAFEARLIEEHGQAYVDDLKERNKKTKGAKFGTPWLEAKIVEYQAILERL